MHSTTKNCSDYKEGEDYKCENIYLADYKKECQLINGQCTEVSIPACEDYTGEDKNECESIVPRYHFNKCTYTGGECKEETKTSFSEFTKGDEEYYCKNIYPNDEDKRCVFTNNECKESYKECSYYTGKEASECTSIIPESGGSCIYESDSCKEKPRKCSDFISTFDANKTCERISPLNDYKKCVYSNNSCKEENKYCLEFTSDATKEICEKAPTSSKKKKCVLADDKKSYIEKNGAYIIKAFSSLLFLCLLL